ncbi:hypothetical protein H5410_056066 [Solanum commersonii]|uniref:SWIM-type domain-containing protein n=1 Tax=Solanum commersonii TaxID=4109 RepID=A0A9J5WL69_SOLCO|nr:hypothetical protein H5410_056066 [Solanum commersonii]
MAMKVLEENIAKSMACNIEFNGVTGYEVLDGYKQHIVCLRNRECSCRSWMLKGIPCAHALAAMLHKQYDPYDFIHPCYSKERYLMTYSHFIQPMNNMPMWPDSRNPLVAPPVIKQMSGRPRKLRRKEAGEAKVSGKLFKTGLTMTCSLCHVKGHTKRSCHLRRSNGVGSTAGEQRATPTSNVEEPSTKTTSANASACASASASASACANAIASGSASRVAPRTTAPPTTSRTPRHEASASVRGAGVSSRAWSGRGKGIGLGSVARGDNHPLENWFTCSKGSTTQGVDQNTNVAPKETATAGKERMLETQLNLKGQDNRILAGPKRVLRSNVVTGDVGFKLTSGLKWKENQAITTRRLQQIRDQSRLLNPNASSSSQPRDLWKL